MNMRLIVRDNAGGLAYDETVITVTQDAGPFELLEPNGGEAVTSSKVISWDVARTDVAPISTAEVEFSLSIDGGETFPVDLGTTDNDGYHPRFSGRNHNVTGETDDQREGQYLL